MLSVQKILMYKHMVEISSIYNTLFVFELHKKQNWFCPTLLLRKSYFS